MQIRAEPVVGGADLDILHPLYLQAMSPLLTRAAARHALSLAEFSREMDDPRILKFLVRDDDGAPCALTTLTRDLSAFEWVNPTYFTTRFPDAVERDALFYLGYTLVAPSRRRSQALVLMAGEIRARLEAIGGVVGFDICAFNHEHGIGRWAERLFGPQSTVTALDTQTYSVADYRHGPAAGSVADAEGTAADTETIALLSLRDRPDLADEIGGLLRTRWPRFMLAGRPGHDEDLDALVGAAPGHQVVAVDEQDRVCGVAFSLPLDWDGTSAGLPAGWDDAVTRSAALGRSGRPADAATALSVTVASHSSRRGLSARLIAALRDATAAAGGRALIAPVRPLLKASYPLVPMADFLTWRAADGDTFDPWLRTHLRAGAEVLGVAPASMTVTAGVEDWRGWVDDPLPGPGQYVIPGGLAPLVVTGDTGTYVEPNVWVAHRV